MMIKVEPYKATLDAIEERLTEMGKESNMHNVMKKAINEVAGVGKELIYTETRNSYTIKRSVFKKSDIVKKSTSSRHPGATLTIKGETIGVKEGYQSRKNGKRKGASAVIIKGSAAKELKFTVGGHAYRAFLATMKNKDRDGNVTSEYTGIFQRVPGKYMKDHYPIPGKSKGHEAIKKIVSLSKAKAAETAYKKQGLDAKLHEEIIYRMLKHMNAVIGGTE